MPRSIIVRPYSRLLSIGGRRCYAIPRMARIANLGVVRHGKLTLVEVSIREDYTPTPQTRMHCRLVCDTSRFHELLLAMKPERGPESTLLPGYAPTSGYVNVLCLYSATHEPIGLCSSKRTHPIMFRARDVIETLSRSDRGN